MVAKAKPKRCSNGRKLRIGFTLNWLVSPPEPSNHMFASTANGCHSILVPSLASAKQNKMWIAIAQAAESTITGIALGFLVLCIKSGFAEVRAGRTAGVVSGFAMMVSFFRLVCCVTRCRIDYPIAIPAFARALARTYFKPCCRSPDHPNDTGLRESMFRG